MVIRYNVYSEQHIRAGRNMEYLTFDKVQHPRADRNITFDEVEVKSEKLINCLCFGLKGNLTDSTVRNTGEMGDIFVTLFPSKTLYNEVNG